MNKNDKFQGKNKDEDDNSKYSSFSEINETILLPKIKTNITNQKTNDRIIFSSFIRVVNIH